jgi:phosphoribosylanthranilate isomerase
MTRVKFCGITRPEDAELAVRLGAWAIGLNLWPGSRRHVTLEQAAELAAPLKRRIELAGVFVNPTLDEVAAAAEVAELTLLQFHGDEGLMFCLEAARRTGCRVIKAGRIAERADIQAMQAFRTDFHLFDSHVRGALGGTGETFAWELLRGYRSKVPMILAGGLTPANVGEAIAIARPFAVDVASGIEPDGGDGRRKDPEKMAEFAWAVAS